MEAKVNVGIIGCGNILPQYVQGCRQFSILNLIGCADIDHSRAQAAAKEHALGAYTVDELLAAKEIHIIINLTIPTAHASVSLSAIKAGKHIYSEKPLALTRDEGRQILDAARSAGVRVGCAPDTFLGGGLQTSLKLIDDGVIGTPIAAAAFFLGRGPERWHPNPDFFYKFGAGPLFDLGPYYLTSLIALLGGIQRVTASARASFPERIITGPVRTGEKIRVEVPTHVAGVLDFASGPVATLITSFDVWNHNLPRIEIYGSDGTLSVPDPNIFGGSVRVWTARTSEWREVELTHDSAVMRGIGVADMAYALQSGRAHRASGAVGFHVLDVMQALGEASEQEQHLQITSRCERPAPLPVGLKPGTLDA